MNYNLEDVILEKYVEGVIDDEHYLSLYEAATDNKKDDEDEKETKKRIKKAKLIKVAAIAAGVSAVAAATIATKKFYDTCKREDKSIDYLKDKNNSFLDGAFLYKQEEMLESLSKAGDKYDSEIKKLYEGTDFSKSSSVDTFKKSCDSIFNSCFKDFIRLHYIDSNGVSRKIVMRTSDLKVKL